MAFLHLVRRYLASCVIISLFGLILGLTYQYYNDDGPTVKTQLFLVVAVKSDLSSIGEVEQASTYFGETIMGWFRNPAFISEIIGDEGFVAKISAYKQERQNMIVEVISDSEETNSYLIKNALTILRNEIDEFNSSSNVKYMVLDQGRVISKSSIKDLIFPFVGFGFGIFLALFIAVILEVFRGAVSSIEQVESILGVSPLEILTGNINKDDFTMLSVAIQKMKPLVIFAGVGVDTDALAVAIAQRQSFFGEQIVLVDGDLQRRNLQHTLGLSSRLKNLKGYTDYESYDSKDMIVQNTLDENLKFVPVGTGNKFLTQVFTNIASKMKTLIHTRLPDNAEVLRLKNANLVLVVKLGVTRVLDLKRINEVWNEEISVVIIG